MTNVTITYLAMTAPAQLRPKDALSGATVARVPQPMPELNRFFYTAIGGEYGWYERRPWTRTDWLDYLNRPGVETWVLNVEGVPAGYFELAPSDDGSIDIRLFGILSPYVGKGYGGYLLTEAVRRAWAKGASTVTVDTCTLDHASALAHYQARGFQIVDRKTKQVEIPNLTSFD